MPKRSAEYHEARRAMIAVAATRVFEREGLHNASMAAVMHEASVSAGSFYSNFDDKADLVRLVAAMVLDPRVERLRELRAAQPVVSPRQATLALLQSLQDDAAPTGVMVQLWSEGSRRDDLGEVVREVLRRLLAELEAAVTEWSEVTDDAPDPATAARTALGLIQGWVVQAALGSEVDPIRYLALLENGPS
jgi:AcrR family transcriptional regulator